MKTRFQRTADSGRRLRTADGGPGLIPHSAFHISRSPRAFTLVEIMIVVAIIAVVMGMGIPSMFRAADRGNMRAAVRDVLEACQQARAAAILTGQPYELQILPGTRDFRVVPAAAVSRVTANIVGPPPDVLQPDKPVTPPAAVSHSVQISQSIYIELLDVNFLEFKDAEEARVKFRPNGTSDEFTIVLRSDANEWRKISLEVTTGLAEMEPIEAFAKTGGKR